MKRHVLRQRMRETLLIESATMRDSDQARSSRRVAHDVSTELSVANGYASC